LQDIIDSLREYAPEERKPECLPWMVQTLPGLVTQVVEAFYEFSILFRIIALHGESSPHVSPHVLTMSKIPNNHNVWDKKNPVSIRTVIVTSFNTANSQYGPTAFTSWKRLQDPKWRPPKEGFSQPEKAWHDNPRGQIRGMIFDESQYGFRNENSLAETVRWFNPPTVWMFSGSPTPRGLHDWVAYLTLFEHEDLAKKAKFDDDTCGYKPAEDPYLLDDNHPAVKYRFTSFAFKKWIVDNKKLNEFEKGIRAQSVLRWFVLRRDYSSMMPIGSDQTMAENCCRSTITRSSENSALPTKSFTTTSYISGSVGLSSSPRILVSTTPYPTLAP
jgi:hypothetical protein